MNTRTTLLTLAIVAAIAVLYVARPTATPDVANPSPLPAGAVRGERPDSGRNAGRGGGLQVAQVQVQVQEAQEASGDQEAVDPAWDFRTSDEPPPGDPADPSWQQLRNMQLSWRGEVGVGMCDGDVIRAWGPVFSRTEVEGGEWWRWTGAPALLMVPHPTMTTDGVPARMVGRIEGDLELVPFSQGTGYRPPPGS